MSFYISIDALPLKLFFLTSAGQTVENGVPLKKWHCLTIGSLSFLGME